MTSETHTPGFACIMQARILNDIADNRLANKINNKDRKINIALLSLMAKYPPHRSEITQQTTGFLTHQDIVRIKLHNQLQNLQYEYHELVSQSKSESEIINHAYNMAYHEIPDCTTNVFTRISKFFKTHTK